MKKGDPRNNPEHRERGVKRWYYTYKDVSKITGLSVDRLRHMHQEGAFDMGNLQDVVLLGAERVLRNLREKGV